MCLQTRSKLFLLLLLASVGPAALLAQTGTTSTSASTSTFGNIYGLSTTPTDILLDEPRNLIYLVHNAANRIDIFDLATKRVSKSIATGNNPSAIAMSMDGAYLYVTNAASSSLTVIDARSQTIFQTVNLGVRPEGVEVGADGRVLITTQGSGTNNALNQLLIYDRTQETAFQVAVVNVPPVPTTPTPLPQVTGGRPNTPFPGRLIRTPDGAFIVGLSTLNQNANTASTTMFVYEVASGTVIRNRSTHGQSTTLSMSPDGSRFMAGFSLYDTATLAVTAQLSAANLPFYNNGNALANFTQGRNIGGSIFAPSGDTLYLTANTNAATSTRIVANILYVAGSNNLGVRLGLRLKESITGKIVSNAAGDQAYALSETGLMSLPLGKIFDFPIIQPETTQVFLTQDNCDRAVSRTQVRVSNLGKGKLTYTVSNPTTAVIADVATGNVPSTITFTMDSGRANVTRIPGTNLFTGAGGGGGTPLAILISSPEAVNIPNVVKVYMNYRQPDMRGVILPIPTGLNNAQGLWDSQLDRNRNRLYISNPSFNRIEVYDTKAQALMDPIEVGQLPHAITMTSDGAQLYVGNSGGESISIVDLETLKVSGRIDFPAIPRLVQNQASPTSPVAMAYASSGLQFMMSNGGASTFWKVASNSNMATPRPANNVTPIQVTSPVSMSATPGGDFVMVLTANTNASAYLYDANADTYTAGKQAYEQAPVSYFGPTGAAPNGSYFLANGLILSSSLAIVGGTERPGATQITFIQVGNFNFPQQQIVSNGQRNVAAVIPIDENTYLRMTTPVRQNINSVTKDDARTTIEAVNIATGSLSEVAIGPDSPQQNVFANNRSNIPSRQLNIDQNLNAYAITMSGLSVMPLDLNGPQVPPAITGGALGVINATDNSSTIKPGSFISITGTNLAATAVATSLTPPTVLGGSCVTVNDQALPLLQVSPTQIVAQIPETAIPGTAVLQVRSLATAGSSDPALIIIKR